MAAREFHGLIFNEFDSALFRTGDDVDSGQWQDPWYPSRIPGAGEIAPQQWGEWRSESDGVMTGTSGWARWAVRVLEVSEGVEHFEFVQVNWSIPFNQALSNPDVSCGVSRNNPDEKDAFARPDPRPPILEIVPTRRTVDGRPVPTGEEGDAPALAKAGEILPYVLTVPLSLFFTVLTVPLSLFFTGAFQWIEHPVVPFRMRQRRTDQTQSALPIAPPPPKGIVYTVTLRIEAMARIDGRATRASGGNLTWYHHTGREDGSFNWEGPKIVGTSWGQLKHVFSGGDEIIYAVTPVVEASLPSGIGPGMGGHPASGGELWWYRHSGRDDGSFRWDGPKKVGTGWGRVTHVFSGGNGVIYAIDPVVEASVHVTGGTTPASGGDLWWYRHVGRADGSLQWEGPKKVGTGWVRGYA